MDLEFRLGASRFTLVSVDRWPLLPELRNGYARAVGMHFDFSHVAWLGLLLSSSRVRESDTHHPECIGGYLRSDVTANPALVARQA